LQPFRGSHDVPGDDPANDSASVEVTVVAMADLLLTVGAPVHRGIGDIIESRDWLTADWGHARSRRIDYSDGLVEEWAARLTARGWSDVFVFFKREDEGAGPALAHRFIELTS
jgi:uncharacterized protein YecE (DUF72 family)